MKSIKPSPGPHSFPRKAAPSVECRKRDLVIRIADWTRQSPDTGEPAFDVEVYVGGVYDSTQSRTFCTASAGKTKAQAKAEAVAFASAQIAALL